MPFRTIQILSILQKVCYILLTKTEGINPLIIMRYEERQNYYIVVCLYLTLHL